MSEKKRERETERVFGKLLSCDAKQHLTCPTPPSQILLIYETQEALWEKLKTTNMDSLCLNIKTLIYLHFILVT